MKAWNPCIDDKLRIRRCVKIARKVLLKIESVDSTSEYYNYSQHCTNALLEHFLFKLIPNAGYNSNIQENMDEVVSSIPSSPPPMWLFGGASEIGLTAQICRSEPKQFSHLLYHTDKYLEKGTIQLISTLKSSSNELTVGDFDLISGLSGLCTYWLSRYEAGAYYPILDQALEFLSRMCISRENFPQGFIVKPEVSSDPRDRKTFNGSINCGIAHGIPGPLAVLSLAAKSGIRNKLTINAIERLAEWLLEIYDEEEGGWPDKVELNSPSDMAPITRYGVDGWCYGTLGVARAVYLASGVLRNKECKEVALQAMQRVVCRSIEDRGLISPTLCHGKSGLLLSLIRFFHDSQLPIFREAAYEVLDDILADYDDRYLYGFRDKQWSNEYVNDPSFLTGSSGVALTLLGAVSEHEPVWDRFLLFS